MRDRLEQLVEIMDKFTEMEYDIESVLQVINGLEENYEFQGQSELALNVHFVKRVLDVILVDMKQNITQIDVFIMEHKEKSENQLVESRE